MQGLNSVRSPIPGSPQLDPGDLFGIVGIGFEIAFHFIAKVGRRFGGEEFLISTLALGFRIGFGIVELQVSIFPVGQVELVVVFLILFENDPGLIGETGARCNWRGGAAGPDADGR